MASSAHAAFPGRNGLIAFEANFTCGYGSDALGTIASNGTGMRMITECQPGDIWFGPYWSPDGTSLLFSDSRQIYRVSADGSRFSEIARGRAPSFAPDGKRFVYRRGPQGRDIWRAAIDGTGARLLRPRAGYGPPLWSPNGRTIAIFGFRSGIWLINPRTGERLRRLTGPQLRPLDWSPDGRQLLCARTSADGFSDLYKVRFDGGRRPRRLPRENDEYVTDAAWAPNGRRIVAILRKTLTPRYYARSLMVTMRSSGMRRRVIWQTPRYESEDDSSEDVNIPHSVSWQPRPR